MDLADHLAAGDRTRFYPPRWRLLLLVATCAFLGGLSWLAAQSPFRFVAGLGWLGMLLMGLAAAVLLMRALRPGPTVLIDDEGITDRTTLAPTGLIRWEEITVIRKKEIGRGRSAERMLEIVLADPDAFRARPCNPVRRWIERYRQALKYPIVSIPSSMVSTPMHTVMAAIQQRRPQLQVLEGPPPAPPKFRFARKTQPGRRHPDLPRW